MLEVSYVILIGLQDYEFLQRFAIFLVRHQLWTVVHVTSKQLAPIEKQHQVLKSLYHLDTEKQQTVEKRDGQTCSTVWVSSLVFSNWLVVLFMWNFDTIFI